MLISGSKRGGKMFGKYNDFYARVGFISWIILSCAIGSFIGVSIANYFK